MKMPEKKLKMVHLQISRQCNLRCHFCGQWGDNGFFSHCDNNDMTLPEWKNVIDSIARYSKETGEQPSVMLWGGEPLMYPWFKNIVNYLRSYGFKLGIVTNGVLLNKYSELIKTEFDVAYISIDGPQRIHDSIRGKGVFKKVTENIRLLKGGKLKIIFMTTICPENIEILPDLPYLLEDYGADKILFNELIYFNLQEIAEYKKWLHSSFAIKAKGIDSCHIDLPSNYENRKNRKLQEMLQRLKQTPTSMPVEYLPHEVATGKHHCLSPFQHLHVTWDGSVLFCTDFYDFSAGNIRDKDLIDIWNGKSANNFRQEIMKGNCSTCNHCSWKSNRSYCFD